MTEVTEPLDAVVAATKVPFTSSNPTYSEGYLQAMADIRSAVQAIRLYGPEHYLDSDD